MPPQDSQRGLHFLCDRQVRPQSRHRNNGTALRGRRSFSSRVTGRPASTSRQVAPGR